jgi:hypothetical protein
MRLATVWSRLTYPVAEIRQLKVLCCKRERRRIVPNVVRLSSTYTLDSESFHSIILLNLLYNSFGSVRIRVIVDGNIAALHSKFQADEFAWQELRVSNVNERRLVASLMTSLNSKTTMTTQRETRSRDAGVVKIAFEITDQGHYHENQLRYS